MLLPEGSSPSDQLSFVRSVRKDDCRGLYTRAQPRSRTDREMDMSLAAKIAMPTERYIEGRRISCFDLRGVDSGTDCTKQR